MIPPGSQAWNCTTPGCTSQVWAVRPIAPILCPKCAFWRGVAIEDVLVPDPALDPNVYTLDPVTEDLDAIVRVRMFNGIDLGTVRRVRCLGLWPYRTIAGPRALANCTLERVDA